MADDIVDRLRSIRSVQPSTERHARDAVAEIEGLRAEVAALRERTANPSRRGCGNTACRSCGELRGTGPWCGCCGRWMHRHPLNPDEPWTGPCEACEVEMEAEMEAEHAYLPLEDRT